MTDTAIAQPINRLEHFPVTFFATVMGLAGFALALHMAERHFDMGQGVSRVVLWIAIWILGRLGTIWPQAGRFPRAVAAEWRHPVKLAFFRRCPLACF